jgi:light-harvesting complex 1 beta chain
MASSSNNASARPMLKKDSSAFVVIFAAGFLIFLAIAIVAQTLGWQWRTWLPGAEAVKSMTGGVKAAVYTFMSHLL